MNTGYFQGLVMNRVIITGKQNYIYMLIRERKSKKREFPNLVPAICFTDNRKFITKKILKEILPGTVVSIEYSLKSLRARKVVGNNDIGYEDRIQPYMVIKNIELLYVFAEPERFESIEELVDIKNDELFKDTSLEDLQEIDDLIESRLEEVLKGERKI